MLEISLTKFVLVVTDILGMRFDHRTRNKLTQRERKSGFCNEMDEFRRGHQKIQWRSDSYSITVLPAKRYLPPTESEANAL